MKPLNSKERKKAFWRFTGLFLLAILPICVTIFLYGRVSHAENQYLRRQLKGYQMNQSIEEGEAKMYGNIVDATKGIKSYLLNNSARDKDQSANIGVKITDFENSLNELRTRSLNGTASQSEKTLLEVSQELEQCLTLLNDSYYHVIYEDNDESLRNLKECEEENEKLEKDLDRCNSQNS